MKKAVIKFVKKSLRNTVKTVSKFYSPYIVYNAQTGGTHYAWTRAEALGWLSCYNPKKLGRTEVYNFFGNLIAATF